MSKQEKLTNKKNYSHLITWLVFLCFFSIFTFNGFTYAQYTTNNNGFDNGTIAKIYVNSPNTDSISITFDGSDSDEKLITFQILNFNENVVNEVLLDYSVRIFSAYENLPLEYKLTNISIDEGNNVITNNAFYYSGHEWTGGILLGSTHCSHTYTLTTKWQNGQYDADTYANEIDLIEIIIDSEQLN